MADEDHLAKEVRNTSPIKIQTQEPLYITSAPVLRSDAQWHDAHESLLKTWRRQASINMWLQTASSYYYRRMNGYLAYPSILLSAVTSIGVFGIDTCDNALGGKYITSCMSLISAFLIGINKHAQAAEKAQEFMLRSRDFYSMIRDIDVLLSTPKHERGTCSEVMTRMRSEFDRIVNMSLDPPHHIILQYEKKFRALEQDLYDLQLKEDTPDAKLEPNKTEPNKPSGNSPAQNTTTTAGLSEVADNLVSQYATQAGMYNSYYSSNRYSTAKQNHALQKRVQKVILSPYQLYNIPVQSQGAPNTDRLPIINRMQSFTPFQQQRELHTGETAAAYLQGALSGGVDIMSQKNSKSGNLSPAVYPTSSPFMYHPNQRRSIDIAGRAPHELASAFSVPQQTTLQKAITTIIDGPQQVFNNLMHGVGPRHSAGGESTATDRRRSRDVSSIKSHKLKKVPPPIVLPQQESVAADIENAQEESNIEPNLIEKSALSYDKDWERGESRDNFEVSLTLGRAEKRMHE